MSNTKQDVGRALRFIASEGSADQDANIVAEMLDAARDLATGVLTDQGASAELRSKAEDFLERLRSDAY
jgi:hypothetical protein